MVKRAIRYLLKSVGYNLVKIIPAEVDYSASTIYLDLKRLFVNKENPVIFDIGANTGQTLEAFKYNFPDSSIYSFEPGPETYFELKRSHDKKSNVHLENMAVASTSGQRDFLENKSPEMSSFLEYNQDDWGGYRRTIKVNAVSVDDYCIKNNIKKIDLLKVDTQGYELEVFKGAIKMMKQNNIQLLYFEFIFSEMYKDIPSFGDVFNFLIQNNFKIVRFYDSHYMHNFLSWIDVLFVNMDYKSE